VGAETGFQRSADGGELVDVLGGDEHHDEVAPPRQIDGDGLGGFGRSDRGLSGVRQGRGAAHGATSSCRSSVRVEASVQPSSGGEGPRAWSVMKDVR
jgi:hypothetical protein